jgi:predicted  nucleic acid-binding Zn-ribbon protein
MLPEIQNLIDLQKADREIHRLKDEIAALPRRVAAIEEKLAGTKAALEKAKNAVKADEGARRKYESAIQDLQGKISKYRDQSLAVKTNEQYKALLQEIQFAEQEIRANEDKILELMVNAEGREKEVKAAEADLKAEMAEIEKEKAEARKVTEADEAQLKEWNGKREQLRSGVDPDLLHHYDRVAKHRGSGLAEARDQKCMGCQVMLRPQTFNEIRSSSRTVVCDSCQRILYYDPAHDAEVAAVAETNKHRRRVHPKFDASQAWYYSEEYGESGEVFLVFINAKGGSSRQIFDAATGRHLGDVLLREGEYRLAFPEDLKDGTIRLNGNWSDAAMEEWAGELPSGVLDALHRDLNLARAEAKAHSGQPKTSVLSAEHPAAS